jgi:hypothetical protein
MPIAPEAGTVFVPQGYPTALIYTDESAVKVSAGRFFVVGAVTVRKPGQLMRSVRDIRDRHGYFDEFKFSRISRGRFPVFCELIDVLEQSDAHIGACITARLLIGMINRRELVSALLDQVTTPRECAFDDTVRDLVNVRMRSTSLVTAACLDSASSDGLQLADLIAGAVAHQCGQSAMGSQSDFT